MITLDAARAMLLDGVVPLEVEQVAIGDAAGRVLGAAILAKADQPAERRSAMDGYAVTAEDAVAGTRLELVGEAYAGAPFARRVGPGQAVRIATGGVVPDGADRVVMQEIVRREGEAIVIDGPMRDAQFVRAAGADFGRGETLIEAGETLNPARIGLAVAAGVGVGAVRRRVRVAIFTSGDELRQPGDKLGVGEVADSAGPALAALVEAWGGVADRRAPLPDDHVRARELIAAAETPDVMLIIGGASVGDRDVLRAVVAELGATILFDRIAVQPGKPCWHARFADGRLVLGLPGNPASAFVCAHLLLEPLIAALAGRASRCGVEAARISGGLADPGPRETWWRATVAVDASGQRIVTPDPRRDSSLQRPLAAANALLRQPAGCALADGDVVEVIAIAG